MKHKIQNKFWITLLAITIMITLIPSTAFAEGNDVVAKKTVSNAKELEDALNGLDTNVVITVSDSIELSKGIKILGNKEIILQGETNDVKITFDESTEILDATTDHSMFYFEDGANISMTVQNIILDGAKKSRLFCLGNTVSGTKNKLILETGAILQNGHPQLAVGESGNQPSGGAIRLMEGSELIMNDGRIINNTSNRYGGGIFGWSNNMTVKINGGDISGNAGMYAGGIVLLGKNQLFLHGGQINNNNNAPYQFANGIFYQGESMHIGGNAIISDIYFHQWSTSIYIDSELTGDIVFRNPEKIISIFATNNYVLTESDATHLRVSSNNKAFYLDTDTMTIKNTDSHKVIFHSNAGNDSVIQQVPSGYQAMLYSNTFTNNGYMFAGWNTESDGTGISYQNRAMIMTTSDITLYAQWVEIEELELEYSQTQQINNKGFINISHWTSSDSTVATVDSSGKVTATGLGTATISAIGTYNGFQQTLITTVHVEPLKIIYGPVDKTDSGGRPYIVYSLKDNGKAPIFSELLGFYPVKSGSHNGTYEADTSKSKIILNPSMDIDGDVYYKYKDAMSGNIIETDTLPTYPTTDKNGNPHSIEVLLILKNPNYRFTTIGTGWQPKESIKLYITCYENGMKEMKMYLKGDNKPIVTFDNCDEYEYTGEGIVPTQHDLTTLYTKGENSTQPIERFTAHFHSVTTKTAFSSSHLTKVANTELTSQSLKKIAPTELGTYSFVINGYNQDAKTYCYASRRYSIVKGNPKGGPIFETVNNHVELSKIRLEGSMKNNAGIEVKGTFTWDDENQIVQQNTKYDWTFTPDDTTHYNIVKGASVVWTTYYTLIFEENGGSEVKDIVVEHGKIVDKPISMKEGYHLVGWYVDKECTKLFDFETAIEQDMILYAKWELNNNDVTDTKNVDTDDCTNMILWISLVALSSGLLPIITRMKRKVENKI